MKLKSFILTIGLSLFALSGLLAQDKYEYATVIERGMSTDGKYILLFVSYSNGEFKSEQLENKLGRKYIPEGDKTVVLKYLSELSANGWELVGNSYPGYYLLKRKIQ